MSSNRYFSHPTATVDKDVDIGEGTKIWHYCHITTGAIIGERCSLGQNVYVGGKARIGTNVKIQNNVSVYDEVYLEDDVFCGPSMVFTNVINPRSFIVRKDEYRKTVIKKGATLGANSTILCGNTVGNYAMVAAGAVVTKDVLPYALMAGVPARQIGWICRCGITLNKLVDGEVCCESCNDRYHLVEGKLEPLL